MVDSKEEEKKSDIDRKGFITEEDVSWLLQRYSHSTIITLLQEISQVSSPIIDWNALAKRTASGITSARECQMLWRHLAYRDTLMEKVVNEAEPLDDDSDLEFELEAFPLASVEVLCDAESYVKVLMPSNSTRELGFTNRTAAQSPSVANVADDESTCVSSEKQPCVNSASNLIVPACSQKRTPSTGIFAEGLDGSGPTGSICPPKKKRKTWTKEEDNELFAAVEKYGEGNWATIQKSGIMPDRTSSQLSQRWSFHQRKKGAGGGSYKPSFTTPSEERLATRKAIDMALDDFRTGKLTARFSGAMTRPVTQASSMAISTTKSDALPVSGSPSVSQHHQVAGQAKLQKITLNPSSKPRAASKVQAATGKASDDHKNILKAVALAAGGRVATPSTAATFLKAAQSKNALHIGPGGDAKSQSSAANVKPLSTSYPVPQAAAIRSIRPSATTNTPSFANLVTHPTSFRHGTQQMQIFPRKPTNSTPFGSKGATNLDNLLVTNSGKVSNENADRKPDTAVPVANGDELLPEGIRDSKNMEKDGSANQDDQKGTSVSDVIVRDIIPEKAHDALSSINKQVGISNIVASEDRSIDREVVALEAKAAKDKSLEIGTDGNQIAVGGNGEYSRCPVKCVNSQDEQKLAAKETNNKNNCSKEEQQASNDQPMITQKHLMDDNAQNDSQPCL